MLLLSTLVRASMPSYNIKVNDLNTLVKHALTALKESSQNGEINSKNASISIVGVCRFRILGI